MMVTLTLIPNDDDAGQPLFSVGQPVIVFNPFAMDGLIFDEVSAPKHGTVAQTMFVENLGIYAYRLREHSGWFNESWLHVDEHLAEMVHVSAPNKQDEIDGLLDELSDLLALHEVFGGKDLVMAEKIARVTGKLKEVAG